MLTPSAAPAAIAPMGSSTLEVQGSASLNNKDNLWTLSRTAEGGFELQILRTVKDQLGEFKIGFTEAALGSFLGKKFDSGKALSETLTDIVASFGKNNTGFNSKLGLSDAFQIKVSHIDHTVIEFESRPTVKPQPLVPPQPAGGTPLEFETFSDRLTFGVAPQVAVAVPAFRPQVGMPLTTSLVEANPVLTLPPAPQATVEMPLVSTRPSREEVRPVQLPLQIKTPDDALLELAVARRSDIQPGVRASLPPVPEAAPALELEIISASEGPSSTAPKSRSARTSKAPVVVEEPRGIWGRVAAWSYAAAHAVVIGALLIAGRSPESKATDSAPTPDAPTSALTESGNHASIR